jgi:RNA polymerase primary sigma factor
MGTTTTRNGREYEALARYLKAVGEAARLTRDEEHALALRARGGDLKARQKLVRHNLTFVIAIARRQMRGTVRLDDVIQEGSVGLMRAAEKFDPHAGTRFSTYAVWWIRAYIGKYLKEARSTVRPRSGTVAQSDLSLDTLIDEDGDVRHLDRIEDEGPGPEEDCLQSAGDRQVRHALGLVRKRIGGMGWDIVHERLAQDQPRTLQEIGTHWGVSRERVRQVELSTKQFLRRYLDPIERDAAPRRGSSLAATDHSAHERVSPDPCDRGPRASPPAAPPEQRTKRARRSTPRARVTPTPALRARGADHGPASLAGALARRA